MKNVYDAALMSVKHAAWRFNNLAVSPSLKFGRFRTAGGMTFELAHVIKDAAHKLLRRFGIV
jgi:hypothetical protein